MAVRCTRNETSFENSARQMQAIPGNTTQIGKGQRKGTTGRRAKRGAIHGHKHQGIAIDLLHAAFDALHETHQETKHYFTQCFIHARLLGFLFRVKDARLNELNDGNDEGRKRNGAQIVTNGTTTRPVDGRIGQLAFFITPWLLRLIRVPRRKIPIGHRTRNRQKAKEHGELHRP